MPGSEIPRVSVIIPAFNSAATLAQTLAGIQAQGVRDWECLVIDDGSTDDSVQLVAHHARHDPRIRMASNPGRGPAMARNHGALHLARAGLIAFCDADDIWTPDKLTDVLRAFSGPDTDAVYGRVAFFRDLPQGRHRQSRIAPEPLSIQDLLGENPVCTMSNLTIRSPVFRDSGGFDATMVHNEDLEWLIRLVGTGVRVIGRDRLHVWYRTRSDGLSADLAAMQAGRIRALATARRFGVTPDPRQEAVYLRYLARRALRTGGPGALARRLALDGLRQSPGGFCLPLRRGLPTLAGAMLAPVLPSPLRHALFA